MIDQLHIQLIVLTINFRRNSSVKTCIYEYSSPPPPLLKLENFRFDYGYEDDYDYELDFVVENQQLQIRWCTVFWHNISYKRQLIQNKDKSWFVVKNLRNKSFVVVLVFVDVVKSKVPYYRSSYDLVFRVILVKVDSQLI